MAPASIKTGAAQPQSSHVLVGVQVSSRAALFLWPCPYPCLSALRHFSQPLRIIHPSHPLSSTHPSAVHPQQAAQHGTHIILIRTSLLLAFSLIQVDPTAALRAVDIGPPADQAAAAAEFRQFWGDRSELRRFQDGAICEAVVWDCGPADRHLIPDR